MAATRESVETEAPPTWTVEESRVLYNVEGWGGGYFEINDQGHIVVRPDASTPARELDLYELALDLEAQGIGMPLLIRFSDILRSRIRLLSRSFADAIKEFSYAGNYTTVYP